MQNEYYLAKLEGDEDGAEKIDAALRDLGEELEYDDFLFDYYHGGHDDCSCLPWDDYFGPHSVFVEVSSGWIYQRTRVEDFNDSSTNAILGVAGGLVLPAFGPSVWPGSYAFVKGRFYAPLGKTPLFGPASDYYTTLNALLLGEFGVGGRLAEWQDLGWHVSLGGALASQTVHSPFGRDDKLTPGVTAGIGLSYELTKRVRLVTDYHLVYLQQQDFNPFSAFNFQLNRTTHIWSVGLNWTIGSTLRKGL